MCLCSSCLCVQCEHIQAPGNPGKDRQTMEKTVLKIEWPLESDDVVVLSLSEAKEQFPDFFDSSDWVDQICNVTKLTLIDLIDSAMVGDVFYSQFCQVTLIEKETMKCAECQNITSCSALIDEWKGESWICDDCCEVTFTEKQSLEAVAPCQECGEEVLESEACGEAGD